MLGCRARCRATRTDGRAAVLSQDWFCLANSNRGPADRASANCALRSKCRRLHVQSKSSQCEGPGAIDFEESVIRCLVGRKI